MNKSIVHVVLIVLAVLAALYGVYLGVGQAHQYGEGSFYLLLGVLLELTTKVT